MLDKFNISQNKKILIVYIILTLATIAVFWQVNQFDFINLDDHLYVVKNNHVQRGITPEEVFWAFSTNYARFWFPLTWLSFMFDYQLYGLPAGGYHITNLVLHIFTTLLLFWLFNRMTGAIWKSAFVAALFALHPMHVETVAWITKRKDVLSAFFWMLTLCLYVCYTGKPVIKRYLLVLFSFVCALMSKPMVVTLPVIMILLDYWPLGRFKSQKENPISWQLKEKIPFFVLSAVFSVITLIAQQKPYEQDAPFPFFSRLANATVSFISYPGKMFWPHDLAAFYPFPGQIPSGQVLGSALLIFIISIAIIIALKRLPYLFVGWFWYAITIMPVIGIIQNSARAMSDNYTYLPSIGIAIMLAWGIPLLFPRENMRKKFLFPAGIAVIIILSVLAWRQCGYWKNSIGLWNHALKVTKNNYLAHNFLAGALAENGKTKEAIDNFNKAICLNPYYQDAYIKRGAVYFNSGQYQQAIEDYNKAIRLKPYHAEAYFSKGIAYDKIGQFQLAIKDYNEAIRLKPDYAEVYFNRGIVYDKIGQFQLAIKDYNEAIRLKTDKVYDYNNRGTIYDRLGQYQQAIADYNEVIRLRPDYAEGYNNRGLAYGKLGQYQQAIDDFNKAIRLKPNYVDAYNNRGFAYLLQGNKEFGCRDTQKACSLGMCKLFEVAKGKGLCR